MTDRLTVWYIAAMERLRAVVERSDTFAGKTFDLCVQGLIIVSLVSFSVETLPDLSPTAVRWLWFIEVFCVVVFSIEYVLRVVVSKPTQGYVFSFFGLVDLCAILPFYIGLGVDLRSVRIFRVLRLFRILKLARYSAAVRRFHVAFQLAKEEVVLFLCATGVLLYVAAVGIYYFEKDIQPESFGSIFSSLWWAVTTLTTVGYGDAYPVTTGGKIFTFLILLVGLGVISVPAGLVASALGRAREMERQQDKQDVDIDG